MAAPSRPAGRGQGPSSRNTATCPGSSPMDLPLDCSSFTALLQSRSGFPHNQIPSLPIGAQSTQQANAEIPASYSPSTAVMIPTPQYVPAGMAPPARTPTSAAQGSTPSTSSSSQPSTQGESSETPPIVLTHELLTTAEVEYYPSEGFHTSAATEDDVESMEDEEETAAEIARWADIDNLPADPSDSSGRGEARFAQREHHEVKEEIKLAPDGSFRPKRKVVTCISVNMKQVIEGARMSLKEFTANEKKECENRFRDTFEWDPSIEEKVMHQYHQVSQERWTGAMRKAKEWWLAVCLDPLYAKTRSTWIPKDRLKAYVKFWLSKEHKKRSKQCRLNRLKLKGPTFLGGPTSQDEYRLILAGEKGCLPEEVPIQDIWLRTRAKLTVEKKVKWVNEWCKQAYDRYVDRMFVLMEGKPMDEWEPFEVTAWMEAVGEPRKGRWPGIGGEPEFIGVPPRKFKRVYNKRLPDPEHQSRMDELVEKNVELQASLEATKAEMAEQHAIQQAENKKLYAMVQLLLSQQGLSTPLSTNSTGEGGSSGHGGGEF